MLYVNAPFEGRPIFELPHWQADREVAMRKPMLEGFEGSGEPYPAQPFHIT